MLNGYMVIMLILFTNFYIHEYVTRSNDAKRRKQQRSNEPETVTKDDLNKKKSNKANGLIKHKET
jgi:hypothetical protein